MTKEKLLTTFLLGLFGVSGPLAKLLAGHYHLDSNIIEFILTVGQMATPLAAGGVYWFMTMLATTMAHIKAMPPSQQAQVAVSLPDAAKVVAAATLPIEAKIAAATDLTSHEAVQMAAALPDAANLAAVNAMPDVTKVVVRDNASDGVGEALQDSTMQKVVPQSQQ